VSENLKGITIWILAFFSFLAGATVIDAVIMWSNLGPETLFTPYVVGGLTGQIPVYIYLLLSVLVTLVFLAGLAHKLVSDLSPEDQMRALAENMTRLEGGHQAHQKTLQDLQDRVSVMDETLERTAELSRGLSEQGENVLRSLQSLQSGQQTNQNALQDLNAKIGVIDESVARVAETSRGQNELGETMLRNLESSHQAHEKLLEDLQKQVESLEESFRSVRIGGIEQETVSKAIPVNLDEKIGAQIADVKETVAKQLSEVENAVAQQEQKQKKNATTITKQKTELAGIKSKLETLEIELSKPKPALTSQNDVTQIKGIGPKTGLGLKEMGITNVGEFIIADTKAVAEKLGTHEKNVEKLQNEAQLLMVPGLNKKDVFLLEQVEIGDRKSLAEQDPIELTKKINGIFKANVEKGKVSEEDKPTIEEIDSWVKFVKS
jgi:predicted flap endonuclease-1-like 5' DNA nuclease